MLIFYTGYRTCGQHNLTNITKSFEVHGSLKSDDNHCIGKELSMQLGGLAQKKEEFDMAVKTRQTG